MNKNLMIKKILMNILQNNDMDVDVFISMKWIVIEEKYREKWIVIFMI